MNVQTGKQNVRNLTKKNFSHDANLTLPFGEVASIYSKEMNPRSSIKVEHKDLVRLAPMVSPTFGRVFYKTYSRFIPYAEIWSPFQYMLNSTKYNSGVTSYIPTKVPQITIRALTAWLLSARRTNVQLFKVNVFKCTTAEASADNVTVTGLTHITALSDYYNAVSQCSNALQALFGITLYFAGSSGQFSYAGFDTSLESPLGGDFNLVVDPSIVGDEGDVYTFSFRLTHYGKHLRTILMSLGYSLDLNNTRAVSVLPLISWYKGYYDLFVPSHNGTSANVWADTAAFALMKYLEDYNYSNVLYNDTAKGYFTQFMEDVANAYYYQKADFFGSHISQPSISNSTTTPSYNTSRYSIIEGSSVSQGVNYTPVILPSVFSSSGIIADSIRMLLKLTPFVNLDTIFGGRLDKAMKAKFGDDYKSMFVSYDGGRGTTFCQIDDVMSNADTASGEGGAYLGEYAGKGIGSNVSQDGKGDYFKYSSNTFGIFIIYATIVPESKFVNGLDYNLIHGTDNKWSFYTPTFDALGNVVNQKDILIGNRYNFYGYGEDTDEALNLNLQNYGLIPRYSEMKSQACGLCTGDLSLPSLRNSMQPFTLDKLIDDNVIQAFEGNTHQGVISGFTITRGAVSVANPEYLTIGKYRWMGRYNRIFVQDGDDSISLNFNAGANNALVGNVVSSDNFIIHNILDIEYYGPEIPMEDSFDTDSQGKETLTVDKL